MILVYAAMVSSISSVLGWLWIVFLVLDHLPFFISHHRWNNIVEGETTIPIIPLLRPPNCSTDDDFWPTGAFFTPRGVVHFQRKIPVSGLLPLSVETHSFQTVRCSRVIYSRVIPPSPFVIKLTAFIEFDHFILMGCNKTAKGFDQQCLYLPFPPGILSKVSRRHNSLVLKKQDSCCL